LIFIDFTTSIPLDNVATAGCRPPKARWIRRNTTSGNSETARAKNKNFPLKTDTQKLMRTNV